MKKYVIITTEGDVHTVLGYDILDAIVKSEINSCYIHSVLKCSEHPKTT